MTTPQKVAMQPITVEFPLRGDWTAVHTPAEKVPSHGVDVLGQTYAYDFMKVDWGKDGFIFHDKSTLRFFTVGVSVNDCYGFGEPIYSPVKGEVVMVEDGLKDHRWVHPIKDFLAMLVRSLYMWLSNKPNLHKIIGNYFIVKIDGMEAYAFFAHAKKNSIKVNPGDKVQYGQHVANVGHTGNSSAPHLHFHLMDQPNLLTAHGLPCNFSEYKAFNDGVWVSKQYEMPAKREQICVKEA